MTMHGQNNRWATLLLLMFVVLLVGCTAPNATEDASAPVRTEEASTSAGGADGDTEEVNAVEQDSLRAIVAANNRFGLLLHESLSKVRDEGENVFFSPLSIHLALSMVYNGAAGDTAAALAEALQLDDLDVRTVNEAHRKLREVFASGEKALGVRLAIANAIWHREQLLLRPEFVDDTTRYYGALLRGLDFADTSSVQIINDWVSEQTEGLIDELVEALDEDMVTLLVNTVYFKGEWTTPFEPGFTRDGPFHLASGATRTVPFMYRDGHIDHFAGGDFEAVRLPYGEDGRMAMYVFLPSGEADLDDLATALSEAEDAELFAGFRPKLGEVHLPRLDIGYKATLNDVLRSLGMGVAFDPGRADLSLILPNASADTSEDGNPETGLSADRLYIGDVVHQSVLKVDEEGTEAAAATSVGVRTTSMPMYKFRFVADRPFFLVIRDDDTGALLFVGSIVDPN